MKISAVLALLASSVSVEGVKIEESNPVLINPNEGRQFEGFDKKEKLESQIDSDDDLEEMASDDDVE